MEAAKDRVGRNDRLSQGWSRKREEARDRVGRNDRLGQGRWVGGNSGSEVGEAANEWAGMTD